MAIVHMMIGLPGSGKTTYAKKNFKEAVYLSSDEIRVELFGFEDQTHNGEVFNLMNKRMHDALKQGKDVIYDATNLSRKRRVILIDDIHRLGHQVFGYMFLLHFTDVFNINKYRPERHIPEDKLRFIIKTMEIPIIMEGFDRLTYELSNGNHCFLKPIDYCNPPYDTFSQDNPYHKESLAEHIRWVWDAAKQYDDRVLELAAAYHDVGKDYTREYNAEKGYYTYYNHHNISGYMLLCNEINKDNYYAQEIIDALLLVVHHMDFYMNNNMQKVQEQLGQELFDKLLILHKLDDENRIGE